MRQVAIAALPWLPGTPRAVFWLPCRAHNRRADFQSPASFSTSFRFRPRSSSVDPITANNDRLQSTTKPAIRGVGVDERESKNRTLFTWSWVIALGALGTYGFHIPFFSSGFEFFPGTRGDARAAVYLVEHWYQVFLGRGDLLSPGMFYPLKASLR